MKRLNLFLLSFLLFVAVPLRATLEYLQYDIGSGKVSPVATAPTDSKTAFDYNKDGKILFVRDSEEEDQSYYIAVFELTNEQAAGFWSTHTYNEDDSYVAFSAFESVTKNPLPTSLAYPTATQWEAYVDEKPVTGACNLYKSFGYKVIPLSEWFSSYINSSKIATNTHGLYDTFGNVAECTITNDVVAFRGGEASMSCFVSEITRDWSSTSPTYKGVRPIYVPPKAATYMLTVTVDGDVMEGYPKSELSVGETVTVTAPEAREGCRLSVVYSPDSITSTTFEMPASDVTITYTYIPEATISVVNGTVDGKSSKKVVKGDTVTLLATPNTWQIFKTWSCDGATLTDASATSFSFTVPEIDAGATITFTAGMDTYPRVLVFGGTVEAQIPEKQDFGNGYYKPGAKLTIKPYDAPKGYKFIAWMFDDEDETIEEDATFTYTVGEKNTTVTLTAYYEVDASSTNSDVLYIGVKSEDDLSTRVAMGYTASDDVKKVSDSSGNNTLYYYGTELPETDYAQLTFETGEISYPSLTTTELNTEANRQIALILKRWTPSSGQPYYIGIHEVTEAQYDAVVNTENEEKSASLLPHATYSGTRGEAATFLSKLSTLFGETFEKPTKTQISNISLGAYHEGDGYGDKSITDEMVNCLSDNKGLQNSGAQEVDPYGYYDLWGNAAESFKDDDIRLWGGDYTERLVCCNLYGATAYTTYNNPGAIRAAIEVSARYTVKVTGYDGEFPVLPNQTITLKPQLSPGKAFEGWTVTSGSFSETYAAADLPKTITVTADTILTPNFSETSKITVVYAGDVLGPSTVLPGETISFYTQDPTRSVKQVTISPASAAKYDATSGTITFGSDTQGTVTVTAIYKTAPGFRFELR